MKTALLLSLLTSVSAFASLDPSGQGVTFIGHDKDGQECSLFYRSKDFNLSTEGPKGKCALPVTREQRDFDFKNTKVRIDNGIWTESMDCNATITFDESGEPTKFVTSAAHFPYIIFTQKISCKELKRSL